MPKRKKSEEDQRLVELNKLLAESRERQKRISALMKKVKAGTISEKEDEELQKLFHENTMVMAAKLRKIVYRD